MGSEDLFHKRIAKTKTQLSRKKEARSPYERILIVCEGSKTEPNYFNDLVDYLKLNSANVDVDGSSGSNPISVVKYAIKRYAEEKKCGDSFDRVFCIFDKDTHSNYNVALSIINAFKPKGVFEAINSVPCFEYWLLLHFIYTTKPFMGNDSKSSCENLIYDLKKYLPNYTKGYEYIYDKVAKQTEQAIVWSKKSLAQSSKNKTDNPTTRIHELVVYLQNLKK